VRIGVVADTHVGDHVARLPPEVPEALEGVDLILHAGDLSHAIVLEELGRVAPVVAVRGNHDERAGLAGLPRDALVRAGGARIGLTHGSRRAAVEMAAGLASLATGRARLLGFERTMRRRFGEVDCVVVGHVHLPIHRLVDGVLVFSPGAVYAPEQDPGYDWSGLGGAAYRRFRQSLPAAARVPSVGVIEVGRAGLRASVVPLARPIRVPA